MSPVFAHGQLRLYLLALLDSGPRYGYEIIQDLEQRFHGLYSPSAGTVYPRLAKLEQEGLVRRAQDGRRTTYSLTATGHAQIQAREADVQDLQDDLDRSARELAAQVRSQVKASTADLRAELRDAARGARASATPASGTDKGRPGDLLREIEETLRDLRSSARSVARSKSVDPQLRAEVLSILRETAGRIEDVTRR